MLDFNAKTIENTTSQADKKLFFNRQLANITLSYFVFCSGVLYVHLAVCV